MRLLVVLAMLLIATPSHAMPKGEMDEIMALMREYSRTPVGPFKFKLESDRTRMHVRYEKTRKGYRLAVIHIEPVEFVGLKKGSREIEYDGIPVALVDYHADGTLDALKALYTKRTLLFSGPASRRDRQNYYDAVLRGVREELQRWINPA